MSVIDDNVQIGLGNESGAQIATDYDGTSHYQLIKLVHGDPKDEGGDGGFVFVGDGSAGGSVAPLPVRLFNDNDGGSPLQGTKISGATALNVNILGAYGNTGVATLYAGTSDAVLGYPMFNVGNTSDVWVIRSLTGGTVGYDGATGIGRDFVVVQGISGGFEVAITGGSQPLPVQGTVIATATELDIRDLTGGTVGYDGATGIGRDFVVVQGVSQGYPVRSAIWNQLGTMAAGISGAGVTGSILSYITNEVGVTFGTTVNVTGADLDIRSLTGGTGSLTGVYPAGYTAGFDRSNIDFVAVQGVSLGYPVGSRIYAGAGGTIAPIGASGNALNVNILDAGITINVDVTDTAFLVSGKGPTFGAVMVKGSTLAGATLAPVYIAGTAADGIITVKGAVTTSGTATVSATGLDIRNLTGGTVGYADPYIHNRDFVAVQGVSGGYPLRSTIWNQLGTTAAGISGAGVTGSILSYITNEVGITVDTVVVSGGADSVGVTFGEVGITVDTVIVEGTDLDIRSLTGGTGSIADYTDGFNPDNIDFVAVQGVSLGYPVGARLYGGSGATIVPLSVSGDALDVNIVGTDATVNVDITDTQFKVSGNSTGDFVRVSGTADGAVVIAGDTTTTFAGATAVGVTFDTVNISTATVTAEDFDIRGLTLDGDNDGDFVGITGDAFFALDGISSDVAGISTGIAEIQTWMTTTANGATLPNAGQLSSLMSVDFATESGGNLQAIAHGMSGSDAANSSMKVYVVDTSQPETLNYGHQQVPTVTATTISDLPTLPLKSGVNIKALQTNTDLVFVGSVGVITTTGYPLSAGEELFLEVDDAIKVYTISSTSGQTACWTAS